MARRAANRDADTPVDEKVEVPEGAEATAAVTNAAPADAESAPNVPVGADEQADAEQQAEQQAELQQTITAATPSQSAEADAEAAKVPAAEEPKRAGTVEVRATLGVFAWIDKDGTYQTIQKGETAKVTASQADRAEALGVAERV